MTWKQIDGRIMSVPEFTAHVAQLQFGAWRPSGGVLHNTATPSLKRSLDYSIEHWRDMWVRFYRDEQKWSGGPHGFCFSDGRILLFTPFTVPGVHSPSWNGTKFGIEMVADYDSEDDDAGAGLRVKMTAVAVFAALYGKLGLDPAGIRLHKEDPDTTHACPGRDIDKAEFIRLVQEYMGEAGEHPGTHPDLAVAPKPRTGRVNTDNLNLRSRSSAAAPVLAALRKGTAVTVQSEAMNGTTKWLGVDAGGTSGFVAARYVDIG